MLGPSGVHWPGGSTGPSGAWGPSGSSGASGPQGAVPDTRAAAAMAWDGARENVLLFSGYNPYFQRADTWTWTLDGGWSLRTPAHHPSARAYATMAYDEATSRVILFGGASEDPSAPLAVLGDTWAWDGTDWTELRPAHSPSPRVYAAAVYSPAQKHLVMLGGASADGNGLTDAWTWDGRDWAPLTAVASRMPLASVLGYRASDRSLVILASATAACGPLTVWKLEAGVWTQLQGYTDVPGLRCWSAAVWDPKKERFLLAGGTDGTGTPQPSTWTWSGQWELQPSGALPPVGATGLPPSAAWDPVHDVAVLVGGGVDRYAMSLLAGSWVWRGSGWSLSP